MVTVVRKCDIQNGDDYYYLTCFQLLQGPARPMGGYPGTPQMQHGMGPMSTPGRMGMGTPMGTPHHAGAMGNSPGMPHGYPGMRLFCQLHNT